ncbi:hypothetical protein J6590_019230 [Homalodisca vitripennis]|nr:hypothetical protein J6590_019230 [Homalodisca vitripennis]
MLMIHTRMCCVFSPQKHVTHQCEILYWGDDEWLRRPGVVLTAKLAAAKARKREIAEEFQRWYFVWESRRLPNGRLRHADTRFVVDVDVMPM